MVQVKWLLLFLTIICYTQLATCQNSEPSLEGVTCKFENQKNGVCRILNACTVAIKDLAINGKWPQKCAPKSEFICCIEPEPPKPPENKDEVEIPIETKVQDNNVCGKLPEFRKVSEVYGIPYRFDMFPWHVAIFRDNEQKPGTWNFQCAGTLISSTIILSAAHCYQYYNNTDRMRAVLGKKYINYSDQRDADYAHYYRIKEVIVHNEFTGSEDNFKYDIAIIKLDDQVFFSKMIQPVCLNFNQNENELMVGAYGLVPSWGFLSDKNFENLELSILQLNYQDFDTCKKESQLGKYVTNDKMCGIDLARKQTICKGDSGGGYVFKTPKTGSYFLRGLVSVGGSGCKGDDYALFTNVAKYSGFIRRHLDNFIPQK